jgi:hypothetical protein
MSPKISIFLNGMPEFETLFPLARRLAARGVVRPICFSPTSVLRREPRLRTLVSDAGVDITFRPSKLFKWLPGRYVRRADSHLCLVDPFTDTSAHRRRSQAISTLGQPSIFVQHGVLQGGLNLRTQPVPRPYYSGLVLTYEDILDPAVLAAEIKPRLQVVGFLKPALFAPLSRRNLVPNGRRTVLFCHSYRWTGRYQKEDVERFFDLVEGFARRHPEDCVILRSHRGKMRAEYRAQTAAIAELPNVIVSNDHAGSLKGLGMTDVLGLCDLCVTSASTAALDALYLGKKVAIYDNDQSVFPHLPNIVDDASLNAFVENPSLDGITQTRAHYGEIADNIDRACGEIERFLTNG